MSYLILSTSLRAKSKSAILAQSFFDIHKGKHADTELIDLKSYPIPLCDGSSSYSDPNVKKLHTKISLVSGIIICSPIYNYDVSAALKTLIENTGSAWKNKVVGLIASAGGKGSYMAPLGILNSLMIDFRSVIIPRFVYTSPDDFTSDNTPSAGIQSRLLGLSEDLALFSTQLNAYIFKEN